MGNGSEPRAVPCPYVGSLPFPPHFVRFLSRPLPLHGAPREPRARRRLRSLLTTDRVALVPSGSLLPAGRSEREVLRKGDCLGPSRLVSRVPRPSVALRNRGPSAASPEPGPLTASIVRLFLCHPLTCREAVNDMSRRMRWILL